MYLIGLLYAFFGIFMTSPAHSNISNLRLRLGAEGDILAWLTAGPFPNEGALQLRGTGFRTDYLSGEENANPAEGDPAGKFAWRLATGTVKSGIDLKGLFRWNDPGIGYCYATIESPKVQEAHLLFGSDDGAKVYLDGVQIYSKQIARGIKRDEESVLLRLHSGPNRLLFKIEQGDGDWGLMARIVGGQGLVEVLRIGSKIHDAFSDIRSLSGAKGAFDVEAWQMFDARRRDSERFLAHLRDRANDPGSLERVLRDSVAQWSKRGFDADSASSFCQSAGKKLGEQYLHCRGPLERWAQSPGPLFKVVPSQEDYLSVLKGGRYFAHRDGSPFIPIGANHNPDWPELEQANPLRQDYDPERTDRWFANLALHGVNVIRLMVETPPSGTLEDPVGQFQPEHLIWLDNIFISARRHHVRLWVTPYDTFWMNLRKEKSPYWAINGGPIEKPLDFITSQKAIRAQIKRMEFLIDRYGNSDTIFAWEIMNEIDLWWGASPEQIKAWVDEVVTAVRAYEKSKWGRNQLMTVSFSQAMPKGLNAETAFRRTDLEFATMHLYIGASKAPKRGQEEQAAADFASGVVYAGEQVKDGRPVLDGESGPIDHWIADEIFDDLVFHDMSWAHLMAGGAGPGTRWPYRNPHHITQGMLDSLKAMSIFCAGVPWDSLTGAAQVQVAQPDQIRRVSSIATDNGSLLWYRQSNASPAGSISFTVPPHAHNYRLFDIRKGQWLGPAVEVPPGSEQVIRLPQGTDEAAIWVGGIR